MSEVAMSSQPAVSARARILRLLGAAALGAVLIVTVRTLPLDRYLLGTVDWIRGAGVAGAGVYVVVYVVATVLFLPGSILTLGAGFAYGVVAGTALVWVAANIGAALAFVLGRTLARDWIAGKVAANARFAAIDRAVGREGFRIVLLTRLSPVFPFNLLNYAYGLTRVTLRDYVLASSIGMLPGTVMYVYFGSLITSITELAAGTTSRGAGGQAVYVVGFAIAVGVGVYVTRVARAALATATSDGLQEASGEKGHA